VGQSWKAGLERRAVLRDDAAEDGPGAGDADLLADHGAHGELTAVDAPGDAQTRHGPGQRPDDGVAEEGLTDRARVAVGVDQAPSEALVEKIRGLKHVKEARELTF